mmetsp:Transcript_11123/g.25207  ORF Transcript_11123/g.25207 Transcript_11123/m.25207 type:complete len:1125 (+) Transcript_11123:69-3443(+)
MAQPGQQGMNVGPDSGFAADMREVGGPAPGSRPGPVPSAQAMGMLPQSLQASMQGMALPIPSAGNQMPPNAHMPANAGAGPPNGAMPPVCGGANGHGTMPSVSMQGCPLPQAAGGAPAGQGGVGHMVPPGGQYMTACGPGCPVPMQIPHGAIPAGALPAGAMMAACPSGPGGVPVMYYIMGGNGQNFGQLPEGAVAMPVAAQQMHGAMQMPVQGGAGEWQARQPGRAAKQFGGPDTAGRAPGQRPGRGRSPQGRAKNNMMGGAGAPNAKAPAQQGGMAGVPGPSKDCDWGAIGARRTNAAPALNGMQGRGLDQASIDGRPRPHPAGCPGLKLPRQQQAGACNGTPQKDGKPPPVQQMPTEGQPQGATKPEPWRPSFRDGGASRPDAGIHRGASQRRSVERRLSQERRPTERRHSQERRQFERRPGSKGPAGGTRGPSGYSGCGNSYGYKEWGSNGLRQQSEAWTLNLPSANSTAQVMLVADPNALARAASRLSYLSASEYAAVDCQGQDLSGGGQISLIQVACHSVNGQGIECYLFDVLQLGEHVHAVLSFLQNQRISKIVHDAHPLATALAFNFGVQIAGAVVDATWVYENLVRKDKSGGLTDVLEWCEVSSREMHEDSVKAEKMAKGWRDRPLVRSVLSYAAQAVCLLHATGPVMWQRLNSWGGANGPNLAMGNSAQKVWQACQVGWSLRQVHMQKWGNGVGGVMGGMPGGTEPDQQDPDLDDWLAKRFNPDQGGGKATSSLALGGAVRRAQSQRAFRSSSVDRLGGVRLGDSPRTAEWRAAVAYQKGISSSNLGEGSRDRSNSPTMLDWIQRREAIKQAEQSGQSRSRRAASAGPIMRPSMRAEASSPGPRGRAADMRATDASRPADPIDNLFTNTDFDVIVPKVEPSRPPTDKLPQKTDVAPVPSEPLRSGAEEENLMEAKDSKRERLNWAESLEDDDAAAAEEANRRFLGKTTPKSVPPPEPEQPAQPVEKVEPPMEVTEAPPPAEQVEEDEEEEEEEEAMEDSKQEDEQDEDVQDEEAEEEEDDDDDRPAPVMADEEDRPAPVNRRRWAGDSSDDDEPDRPAPVMADEDDRPAPVMADEDDRPAPVAKEDAPVRAEAKDPPKPAAAVPPWLRASRRKR